MRVTIITAGSRGDVQPYLALGVGLAHAGYEVTLATHELFRELVTGRGLGFRPIAGDPQAVLATAEQWLATGRPHHAIPAVREFLRTLGPFMDALLSSYWEAAQGSELLIYSAVASPVWSIAERLRVPGIAAFLQPLHRTRAFPNIGLSSRLRLGQRYNLLTHAIAEQLAWQPHRRRINTWRERVLGLPPVPLGGPFAGGAPHRSRVVTIYGFSSRVVHRPPDWGPHVHITGYWVLRPDDTWRSPPAVTDFLQAGPPPVSIGFGSMTPRDARQLTSIALEALDRTAQRGILLGGWGGLGVGPLPRTVMALPEMPHEWLLPRTTVAVHHGGAGTTGAALRAGVPSILAPLGFDQPYWAARVAALGVGPPAIPRGRLTGARLAHAITRALDDRAMRQRAASLGAELQREDGVVEAVSVVTAVAR